MAELEEAVYSRLTNHSGTSAIVGTRVYPLVLPQGATLEAVTYQRISGPRESAMGADTGIARPRMQLNSWAASYSEAKALARQVRLALQRWSGTVAGVVVLESFILNELDDYEDDTKKHRVIQDYRIWHRE